MRVLRQLAVIAKRQAPRIAFKTKGSILLLDLADILAESWPILHVQIEAQASAYKKVIAPLNIFDLISKGRGARTLRTASDPRLRQITATLSGADQRLLCGTRDIATQSCYFSQTLC
jgi:hypothetical protein